MTQPKKSAGAGKSQTAATRRGLVENEIYEHAARLFAEKGFGSTTLQNIADAIGVSRPAVYYYFKTKEEILARLVGEITQAAAADVQEIAHRAQVTPAERLRLMTRLNVTRIASAAVRFQLLVKSESELPAQIDRPHREARRGILAAFVRVVEDGMHAGEFRAIDARTGALGVIGLCNWVAWWYQDGDDLDVLAGTLADMAVSSLQKRPTGKPNGSGTDGVLAQLRRDLDQLEQVLAVERRQAKQPTRRPS